MVRIGHIAKKTALIAFIHVVFVKYAADAWWYLITCFQLGNSHTLFVFSSAWPVMSGGFVCWSLLCLFVGGRSGMHNSPEAWSFDPWSMSYPVLVMVVMSPSNILTSCDMKIVTYFMSANLIILDNELCCNPGTRCIILASSGTSWMSFAVCMVFAFDEMVYGRFWLTVALCRGMGLMFCHSFV